MRVSYSQKPVEPVVQLIDNDRRNQKGAKPNGIHFIPIDDTEPHRWITTRSTYFQAYCQHVTPKERQYLYHLQKTYPGMFSDEDHISNGMTYDDIRQLLERCVTNLTFRKKFIYLFFDWDLTITVKEGIYLSDELCDKKKDQYEYFKYIMGGKQRLMVIQSLFQLLRTFHIPVYILTNNTGATKSSDRRPLFLEFVRLIDKQFEESYLLASSRTKPTNSQSNKIAFLRIHSQTWRNSSHTQSFLSDNFIRQTANSFIDYLNQLSGE